MYRVWLFSIVAVAALSFSRDAFAYLDPGTGSMLLQLLLGGVAGALVVGKLYWQRLKDLLFGGRRNVAVEARAAEDNEQRGRGRH